MAMPLDCRVKMEGEGRFYRGCACFFASEKRAAWAKLWDILSAT